MESEIRVFPQPNGEIQRVHLVKPKSWSEVDFLKMTYDDPALDQFAYIYRSFLVPGAPWLFGKLVMFRLPEELGTMVPMESNQYGSLGDKTTAAAALLRRGVGIIGGKPVFFDERARSLWKDLEEKKCLHVICGKLPHTQIIPVGPLPGYMTRKEQESRMKVNASFFIMDPIDCATVYDQIGTPLGLCVKNGVVENPPLFGREALMVRQDGKVTIEEPKLEELELEIGGQTWKAGKNAMIWSRPENRMTPAVKGRKLVIVGCRVAAVTDRLCAEIPASGFVLCPGEKCSARPGDRVVYRGMENVKFGIQVGNSILRDGVRTEEFRSRFYNIRGMERVPFPPSLYPLNFENARAARIALGADADGKPMILWAEGAGKVRYVAGQDSRGASLSDMAEMCAQLGMVNGVNLDGGGSAQILLDNRRELKISDRYPGDNSETERPVPLGLIVR